MLKHPILDQLRAWPAQHGCSLRRTGASSEADGLGHHELFGLLLDRVLCRKLAEGEWFKALDNLVHSRGQRKSWLATVLGHKASRDNGSVLHQRVPQRFEDLALARGDGRHLRMLRDLGRAALLILDDRGWTPRC